MALVMNLRRHRIRRDPRPGDLGAIIAHHGRVYVPEYGVDSTFEANVGRGVAAAGKRGFPRDGEGIWIVELDGRHAGSVALTDEGDGLGGALGGARSRAARPGPRPPADRRGGRRGRGGRLRAARARDVQRPARRRAHLPLARVRGELGGDRPALGPRRAHLPALRAQLPVARPVRSSASAGSSERPFSVSA